MNAADGGSCAPGTSGGRHGWELPAHPRRSRLRLLLAGLGLVVAVALLSGGELAVEWSSGPDELAVERGGAAPLPAAPGAGRDAAARWRAPAPGTWAVLPPAPIGSRSGHVVADLGGRVVVWGGWQQSRPLRNGALLDAATGEWTTIPESPVPQRRHVPVAAGRTLLLLDDQRPQAYSLAEARWFELEPPPLAAGSRLTRVATSTGRGAVVATAAADGSAGPLLAWDAECACWSALPAPPGTIHDDMALVVDGRDLLLLGEGGSGFAHRLRLSSAGAPHPAGWEDVAGPELPAAELASAGVRAVGTVAPRQDAARDHPVYVWLAPRADGPGAPARLLAYRGTWSTLPTPPRALIDPELVVAGDSVVALDAAGIVRHRRGSSSVGQLHPPAIDPLQQRDAASSRGRVVWWGGGAGDGAVWRPESRGP